MVLVDKGYWWSIGSDIVDFIRRCADEEEGCTEKTGPFEDITTLVLSAVLLCLVLIGVLVYMSRD